MSRKPINLADERAARRLSANRTPSDFMPLDYDADPAEHQPIEGGDLPVWMLVAFAAVVIVSVVLVVLGVRSLIRGGA